MIGRPEYDFPASGTLNLIGGLIRSCNPWFYHIGLDLYNQDEGTWITEMARGFGLGSETGIVGVDEVAGQVPEPESQIDATNQAIGQGALLVTPLQVARFYGRLGQWRDIVPAAIGGEGGNPGWRADRHV